MTAESGANRWWENYLVRYLMPSIAGVAIVSWLCAHGGDGLRALLWLPLGGKALDAASLTLLFLYGNLFCYVASYPVLVFHVTRVMDFSDGEWVKKPLSGYLIGVGFALTAFLLFHLGSTECRYWLAFALAVLLVIIQLLRLYKVMSPRLAVDGLLDRVSPAFGFAYALSRRRGVPEVIDKTVPPTNAAGGESERRDEWRRDFIATYRHMREHGNSAFIFLFELALAALVYCVIKKPGQSPEQQLGAIGGLFAFWAVPAVFVHFLGQHLERRFAQYDEKRSKSDTTQARQSKHPT